MKKVLLIEDDAAIADLVALHLRDENFDVQHTESGRLGLEYGKAGDYALIILDLMLPDMNGMDVCRHLRMEKVTTPIIMLTARSEEIDKVLGLETGADDYITKPFSVREFLARVKAILRRTGGEDKAEAQVFFRLSAEGKAWIAEVSLAETDPVEPRWVKVACTQGKPDLAACAATLDAAGKRKADIVLLSEYMAGDFKPERVPGPSSRLMSAKAKEYGMYVAGGMVRKVSKPDRVYNTALLYDRQGELVGSYDKIHPYSPENNEQGVTPGAGAPVFDTDFGRVGIIICYDSWFPDVTQLLALKGAEIILFPNAGHQPEFLYARAGDNGVRIVNSAWNVPYSIHDTLGRNILKADEFVTAPSPNMVTFKDIVEKKVPKSKMRLLLASLDLNNSPLPAYNGGTMMSAPGGRRNRREQLYYMQDEIKKEIARWWEE